MTIRFDNSYARLPDHFYTKQAPVPVTKPAVIAVNTDLARELGIDPDSLTADVLAGNEVPEGADPLAQLYAGHQFGNFVPQLGDGRAILLGEVIDNRAQRRDIQLKGSGRTPYSRGGDGRAWLGPVLREYVVSEAMHALGIPTTRALGAATTGEDVIRETILPGAVLTRVAASHLRVGTFQVFASRGDHDAVRALMEHAIERHYPDADGPLGLISAVTAAQAELIAAWHSVGFIHGVMNTDNMAISGETIDYGPCAFMDAYHPNTVFSSIDQMGRYAYGNQPNMGIWNLAQLATSLLPLMEGDDDTKIEAAEERLHAFPELFGDAWLRRFRAKIGLTTEEEGDGALVQGLLSRMATSQADFANTFRALATDMDGSSEITEDGAWESWAAQWNARLARDPGDAQAVMHKANPAIIPRNHRVEQMIQAAVEGDFAPFHRMNTAFKTPFDDRPDTAYFAAAPLPEERVARTFCGT
ncbi:protein adenylyltransferase SelO [Maritimibacter dapengensis]|uniref:Protein nucleotidyltransferase YdiU n=1 Tax=Maritimibacter dapengensis TaxID=2836868 RepID=A0ABS6SZW8_9RHOB|nr:YdiU family protein [Maritimibacter dapengensis]MBV7378404.1 YdiU family protein [Maritimibacter dapengensis]